MGVMPHPYPRTHVHMRRHSYTHTRTHASSLNPLYPPYTRLQHQRDARVSGRHPTRTPHSRAPSPHHAHAPPIRATHSCTPRPHPAHAPPTLASTEKYDSYYVYCYTVAFACSIGVMPVPPDIIPSFLQLTVLVPTCESSCQDVNRL